MSLHDTVLLMFWLSTAFIVYTLMGYPLLLRVLSRFFSHPHIRAPYYPSVALIIAAHNAESSIARKIENCLALDYPQDKLQILVASDGSTDSTARVVQQYGSRKVRLVAARERRGKHHVQKLAIDRSESEIVVFTDAGIMLGTGALKEILMNFADPQVGCVSSEDAFPAKDAKSGEATYVSSEMALRRLEASIGSIVGATGGFFAARRAICHGWHLDQSSDFFLPLHARRQGFRTVVDPNATAEYGVSHHNVAEFARKVRTIVHGLAVLSHHIYLFDVGKYGLFSIQLLSHKLFRWLLPFAFLVVLSTTAVLAPSNRFYLALLFLECSIYLLAGCTFLVPRMTTFGPLRLLNFLSLSLGASLSAWVQYLKGEKYIVWKPTLR